MSQPPPPVTGRARDLLFLHNPRYWPAWPFLPLVRRRPGLLLDAVGAFGLYGLSATVVLGNLFLLPETLDGFLALPRESFDTPEEVADAGWRVD